MSTANTDRGPPADTQSMYTVHTMFRREFASLPALVRDVTAGDAERLQIIASHIELLTLVLHVHHHSEDVALWPRLLDRAPEEVAPVVHLMERHHESLAKLIAEIQLQIMAWRRSAASDRGEHLADTLERIITVLNEHMGLEEKRVLPIVEKYITADEWDNMIKDGGTRIPAEDRPLVLGMLMYEGGIEIVPAEARSAMQEPAPRAYAHHAERIHGTATPARSKD